MGMEPGEVHMQRIVAKGLIVVALVAGLALPAAAADLASADAGIQAQAQGFAAAWAKHDAHALAAFFGEQATLINPSGRLAVGRAAIEKLFTDEHSTFMAGTTLEISVARVDKVTADVTVVLWDAVVHGMKGPDGKPVDLKNQVTVVELRTAGGWMVVAGRPVVYLPPPAAPHA
jgi:uncharacterized protein (TIGR02246 family)